MISLNHLGEGCHCQSDLCFDFMPKAAHSKILDLYFGYGPLPVTGWGLWVSTFIFSGMHIQKKHIYLGLSPLPVIVKMVYRDPIPKMVHNPGGHC